MKQCARKPQPVTASRVWSNRVSTTSRLPNSKTRKNCSSSDVIPASTSRNWPELKPVMYSSRPPCAAIAQTPRSLSPWKQSEQTQSCSGGHLREIECGRQCPGCGCHGSPSEWRNSVSSPAHATAPRTSRPVFRSSATVGSSARMTLGSWTMARYRHPLFLPAREALRKSVGKIPETNRFERSQAALTHFPAPDSARGSQRHLHILGPR
jgi:hypothetical protein